MTFYWSSTLYTLLAGVGILSIIALVVIIIVLIGKLSKKNN